MAKVKILKKLPKSKYKPKKKLSNYKPVVNENKALDKYLDFYDDIKVPTKKYDW